MFFHNFAQYKNFFVKRTKESVKLYDCLKWADILNAQSFKLGGETDVYLMVMIFLLVDGLFVLQDAYFQRLAQKDRIPVRIFLEIEQAGTLYVIYRNNTRKL
jgi:hypothetical protein